MTLLTQERNRCQQQRALIGAVRRVAIEAVLAHRRMLEQERTALLRVALVARLVDRIGLEQRIGQGTMRIMAVVAAHLPFGQRHMRAAIELLPNIPVTLCTGIVDRRLRHQPLHREFRHGVVAVAAGQIVALVDRSLPVIARAARVTGQAGFRLNIDGGAGIFGISDDESFDLRLGGMFRSGAMTGFTHGNCRIRAVGDVQSQGMQGVRKMICLQFMAGDAGLLPNHFRVGRLRIRCHVGIGESRRRPRERAAIDRPVSGEVRRG